MSSMMLTACVTTRTTVVTDTSCQAFKKISFYCPNPTEDGEGKIISCGEGDTPETITEIREHNAAYDSMCSGE